MNHTRGPWQAMPRNRTNRQKEPTFDVMTAGGNPENWEMVCDRATEANARLIAASPDLLRACNAALAYLADPPSKFSDNRQEAANIIRNAIAKAEG